MPARSILVGVGALHPSQSGASEKGEAAWGVAVVLEEGYLASELASFLGCHPSNVSRALQKDLVS
jgi:hypothetical protein